MNRPTVKGWCPTLMTPMMSGDGLLVRVKPTAARLPASAAHAIADAARRFGNGAFDLTNRGNLQIRGLSAEAVEPFAAVVLEHGLADPDPAREAVRNVLCDPMGADDPAARFDSQSLARKLEVMLAADPAYRALPGKFGVLVDAGGRIGLAGTSADIMVRGSDDAALVSLDGDGAVAELPLADAVDAVARLIGVFLARRRAADRHRRMRSLVAEVGAGSILAEADLAVAKHDKASGVEMPLPEPIGFVALPGNGRGVVGVGAAFGQLDAAALDSLADLAARFGDGTLRVTPWKAVLLAGVRDADAPAVLAETERAGLVVEANDPRRRIVTCAGPRCASAKADTIADATWLAGRDLPPQGMLHLSACAKGCAHPRAAAITVVADADGYAAIRNGGTGDRPQHRSLDRTAIAEWLAGPAAREEVA